MTPLLQEVQALVKNSLALRRNLSEQTFWLNRSEVLNEEQLNKLKAVLEQESASQKNLEEESAERMAKIDADHLKALQNFKHTVLPQFLKKWESAEAEKDHPEDLLKQIGNV